MTDDNTIDTPATTDTEKPKKTKAPKAPKESKEPKAEPAKGPAPKKVVKAEPAPAPTGVQYKFASETTVETPRVPVSDIVLADFDSRATEVEPDDAFVADVKERGIITPLSVVQLEGGKWLLSAGRCRLKTAKILGMKTVPIAPIELKADAGAEGLSIRDKAELICLSENLRRTGLTAWDLAVQFRHFKDNKGWSQTRIAKHLGVKDPYVSQYLGIFDLDKRVQTIIRANAADGGIISKARILKGIKDPETQLEVAKDCFDKTNPWTVSMLTDVVESIKQKLEERERREAAKAEAKEKGKKAKASGSASSDEGGDEEEEVEAPSEFEGAALVLKVTETRKLGELVLSAFNKVRDKYAEAPAKEKEALEVKLAYERGRLDTLKMLFGKKAAPKSISAE